MTAWDRSLIALSLLAIDPIGLKGAVIRARPGPARDAFLDHAKRQFPTQTRLHPSLGYDDLTGGIDLAATLSEGEVVRRKGLLEGRQRCFVLPMAERAEPALISTLTQAFDASVPHVLLALDEGAEPDEGLNDALSDRLAFHLDLEGLAMADLSGAPAIVPAEVSCAQAPDAVAEQLVALAVRLGISSLRAPYFALRAACAHAVLSGRSVVTDADLECAVALVFAPRATQWPDESTEQAPPEPEHQDSQQEQSTSLQIPEEMLLEAVKATLPEGVLERLTSNTSRMAKGSGSGKRKIGNRRGRPLPARQTRAKSGARIDLMATLRAAIPWQKLRKQALPDRQGAIIRPEDLRARRYQELSDRLLIFTVDASGSAALARLGEAKGAVELLLAEAYARRDHVALIAFRGTEAEVLLPPTRSLVQTKRRLADLPGGGGTPTASGLKAACEMADHATRKGLTPTVVLLTDGRSNVTLDGSADRKQAAQDATTMAQVLRRQDIDAIVIDTGKRSDASLAMLAGAMGGHYVAMPRADARSLSETVTETIGA
ncbi:MAG: magnesium chelatase subunit D [Litoreibacter sp.]|nr:magnesium chelatase subunit D [Litoreibacter sp.]